MELHSSPKGIFISQKKIYIDLPKMFQIENTTQHILSLVQNVKLSMEEKGNNVSHYKSFVDILLY